MSSTARRLHIVRPVDPRCVDGHDFTVPLVLITEYGDVETGFVECSRCHAVRSSSDPVSLTVG